MVDILSNQVVTTYLSDLGLKVGESRKIVFLDVIFSYQETWYRDLAEGQYPLTGDNSTLCAVLGKLEIRNSYNEWNVIYLDWRYVHSGCRRF